MTGAAAGTGRSPGSGSGVRPGTELAWLIVLGAAGAGLVLLALRQDWATVTLLAPRPLPATMVQVTGQDLSPAGAAVVVAAAASLAAVLATRGVLRRITGLISAGLGAWAAVLVLMPVPDAGVLAAARTAAARAGSPAAGTGAGSVSAGGAIRGAGGTGAPVAGFPAHVAWDATTWRCLALGGALALIAAGIALAVRARKLPVMRGRFDRPAVPKADRTSGSVPPVRADSQAGLWDALSAGADPTAGPGGDPGNQRLTSG